MNQQDHSKLMADFGNRVREIRKGQSMTMEQMAEKTGLSYRLVSRVELGVVNPKLCTICALAEGLGVAYAEMFFPSK